MSDANGSAPPASALEATLPAARSNGAPATVSQREMLRRAMPSIYHDEDFAMRFVGSLEGVLDPIMAILDTLPEHFSPDFAPALVVDTLALWLGADVDENQTLDARRENVRMAADVGRLRGTRQGLELALRLAFPDVPMRVVDHGGVRWSRDGKPAPVEPARFAVYVDTPIPRDLQVDISRCIERHKPVRASFKLRVLLAPGDGEQP